MFSNYSVYAERDIAYDRWIFWVAKKVREGPLLGDLKLQIDHGHRMEETYITAAAHEHRPLSEVEPSFTVPTDAMVPLLEELALRLRPISKPEDGELRALRKHIQDLEFLLGIGKGEAEKSLVGEVTDRTTLLRG